MFAYCGNNPVTRIDDEGDFWDTVFDLISLSVSVVETILNPKDAWNWLGLAGDTVDLVPFVTGVGETLKGAKTVDKITDAASNVNNGWKVGDNVNNLTKQGNIPKWSTVKSRIWKNEAYYHPDMYSKSNLELMKKGKAPLVQFDENGKYYPKELHHRKPRCEGGTDDITNLLPVSPWEHDEIDPRRHFNPK